MPVAFDHREELCAWLRDHGIDPHEVPENADLTIEVGAGMRWIRCEIYSTNACGSRFMNLDNTDAAREFVIVPLKTEPPNWWQPHTKPSREALLEALGAVRQIHRRNEHTGTCEHCSERDYPDYAVPWPCDTVKALHVLPSVRLPIDLPDPQEAPCSTSSAT